MKEEGREMTIGLRRRVEEARHDLVHAVEFDDLCQISRLKGGFKQ